MKAKLHSPTLVLVVALCAAIAPLALDAFSAPTVAAQSYPRPACNEAQWPEPPVGTEPDLDQCCYDFQSCYDQHGCDPATDWPDAFSNECLGCNLVGIGCIGMALTGEVPEWECPARCDYKGATCGAPDGCGGVCVTDDLCPFLLRHPELGAVLFW